MKSLVSLLVILAMASTLSAAELKGGRVLDGKLHHLGDSVKDTYLPDAPKEPEGSRLDWRTTATKNEKDFTLSVVAWEASFPLIVEVNGKKADEISPSEPRRRAYANIPAGFLKDGENVISIVLSYPQNDCAVGKAVLYPKPLRELLNLQPVSVGVSDDSGSPIPARITIREKDGDAPHIFFAPTNATAVRSGLIYTRGEKTSFQLPAGDYVFYATHGTEWSCDKQTISVKPGRVNDVKLKIRRELDTTGFVAADSHIHTLTFSGHGDSTIHERMVTLAAEGVEVAISTDHNHQVDYRPFQEQLAVNKYFTPVTGNEVTTKIGHFNGFPLPPGDDLPDHKETDHKNLVKVIDGIRAKGAKIVILNHPRWDRLKVFDRHGLKPLTGERATTKVDFTFDAIELVNSGTLQTNALELYYDWFGLLNRGEKILGAGASDSHTVREPVGQGRTYVRSSTDDAAKVDVDEFCKTYLTGDSSVSIGIFGEVHVEKSFKMGELVPVKRSTVEVEFRVAAPSWVKPRRALVFVNGQLMGEQKIETHKGKPTNARLKFEIPAPLHDAYVVCVALGDPVTAPFWTTDQPYTLASSNPVYLDANNDGRYESPRQTALHILAKSKKADDQWREISEAGDGVAAQLLDLLFEKEGPMPDVFKQKLEKSKLERPIYQEFLKIIESSKGSILNKAGG